MISFNHISSVNRSFSASPISLRGSYLPSAKSSLSHDTATISSRARTASRKNYAAAFAGTAAFLIPSVALAGGLSVSFISTAAVYAVGAGMFLGAAGLLYAARTLYLDPRFGGRPGDPTGRRLITKLALPALATVSAWGGALLASAFAASAFGLHSSTFLFGLAAVAVGYTALKISFSVGRATIERLRGIRRTVEHISWKNRVATNVLTFNAQLASALYTSTRALAFASMGYGVLGHGLLNLAHGNISLAAPLLGAGLGLLYGLFYRRNVAQRVNPLQHPYKALWNKRTAVLYASAGAALGVVFSAVGYQPVWNLIFAGALFVVELHDALHAFKTMGGARRVEDDVPRIYSDREIHEAARSPQAEFSTLLKPSFVNEVVPIFWAKIHVREGANWNENQVNSNDLSGTGQIQGVWRMFQVYEQTLQNYKQWIQHSHGQVNAAAAPQDALAAAAAIYERLANAYDTPCADNNNSPACEGNFAHLGIANLGDHTFTNPSDQHFYYLGRLIRTKANDYRQRARELRASAGNAVVARATLDELKADLRAELEALYRKYHVPYDMFLSSFASNILPEVVITKIEQLDAFNALTRDFITGVSIVRRNPDNGDLYMEIIPSNVVKNLRPDYQQVQNIASQAREDNRFRWLERSDHEIGESHSDIAYVDMSDHFRRHGNDLNYYPTANIHAIPALAGDEYYDVVFTNGSRLRCFGDGRRQAIGNVPPSAQNITWVPGTPAPAEQIGNAADHAFGYKYKFYLEEPFAPRFYFFFQTPYQSLSDGEQLDVIVSNQLANLVEDRQTPHAFFQFRTPEALNLPYDPKMADRPTDQLLQVAQGTTWFLLKVKDQTGRTLYVPYNVRKDSYDFYVDPSIPSNHPNRDWTQIDERVPVQLVRRGERVDPADPPCPYDRALVFTYLDGQRSDPSFSDGNIYKRYPAHLGDPEQYGREAMIDLGRGKVGVMPILKFVFLKRDAGGRIIDEKGNTYSDAEWNTLIGTVDTPASRETRRRVMRETMYERFLPLESFVKFWDPGTIA